MVLYDIFFHFQFLKIVMCIFQTFWHFIDEMTNHLIFQTIIKTEISVTYHTCIYKLENEAPGILILVEIIL